MTDKALKSVKECKDRLVAIKQEIARLEREDRAIQRRVKELAWEIDPAKLEGDRLFAEGWRVTNTELEHAWVALKHGESMIEEVFSDGDGLWDVLRLSKGLPDEVDGEPGEFSFHLSFREDVIFRLADLTDQEAEKAQAVAG